MMKIKKFLILVFIFVFSASILPNNLIAYSDGTLDLTFDPGDGVTEIINSIEIQEDEKILIGGSFSSYDGEEVNNIARINEDGSLDDSFDVGEGTNDSVLSILEEENEQILIGGYFTSYDTIPISYIARLNDDGSLDETFDPSSLVSIIEDGGVKSIAIQNNQILIGGSLSSGGFILRLNSNGLVDEDFNLSNEDTDGAVRSIIVLSSGKILISGDFTMYGEEERNGIALLNSDGSLDNSFDPGEGVSLGEGVPGYIYSILIQDDGKILIGGSFSSYDGEEINNIVRINEDGSLDETFDVGGSGPNHAVNSISIQDDNKIIIGGQFVGFNGDSTKHHILRLETDGSLDISFDAGNKLDGLSINSTAIQDDDNILIGGWFSSYDNVSRNGIARISFLDPVLMELNPIESPTTVQNPFYFFSTNKPGTITYGGSCNSTITEVDAGDNTITFNELEYGTYSDCTIIITDSLGNESDPLQVSAFTIKKKPSSGSYVSSVSSNNSVVNTNPANVTNPVNEVSVTENNNQLNNNTNNIKENKFISPLDNQEKQCGAFTSFLSRKNKFNSEEQVRLWQAFLNKYENENLKIDGKFGIETENAVKRFQEKYKEYILKPWNENAPTGYIYKTTMSYANKLINCPLGEIVLDNGVVVNH